MCFRLLLFLMLAALSSGAQVYTVSGLVSDIKKRPLRYVSVVLRDKTQLVGEYETEKDGKFFFTANKTGKYHLEIKHLSFEPIIDTIEVVELNTDLGRYSLKPSSHVLNEIVVAGKAKAINQKGDTLEFNSRAFKVNPDANGLDLIRKMPAIQINGKTISNRGENVVKILVDGIPFFGYDPYNALNSLPAYIIDKVQVYSEMSDKDKFSGFNEDGTTNTINIITKPENRIGLFGSMDGGAGEDYNGYGKYSVGSVMSAFTETKRITGNVRSENINNQNLESADADNTVYGQGQSNSIGFDFSNKPGPKLDYDISYGFNNFDKKLQNDSRRSYIQSVDSGNIYIESNPTQNKGNNHSLNMQLNYILDSMNSISWQPNCQIQAGNNYLGRVGNNSNGLVPTNTTTNSNNQEQNNFHVYNNIIFRHKFHKPRRTLSASVDFSYDKNVGEGILLAQNIYFNNPVPDNVINQQTKEQATALNINGNVTYTQPLGKIGVIKAEYSVMKNESYSLKNVNNFDSIQKLYPWIDSSLSSNFNSQRLNQKGGLSYQAIKEKYDLIVGLNYQNAVLSNTEIFPIQNYQSKSYSNFLPVASLKCKFSNIRIMQLSYSTYTQVPGFTQLQSVVNNTDPLHLVIGNHELKPTIMQTLSIHYNSLSMKTNNSFSVNLNGSYGIDYISNNSLLVGSDTLFRGINVLKGTQVLQYENLNGYKTANANVFYSFYMTQIKTNASITLYLSVYDQPSLINYVRNMQEIKSGGLGLTFSSNINQNTDFQVSSNSNIRNNGNSINSTMNSNYFTEVIKSSISLTVFKNYVVKSSIVYQFNQGLSLGYAQNSTLWNVSIGRKLFKNRMGEIKLGCYDLLNNSQNVQQIITDTYIQEIRRNTQQRYLILSFDYKINSFGKNTGALAGE